jgi:hypothetical protein
MNEDQKAETARPGRQADVFAAWRSRWTKHVAAGAREEGW